VSVDNSALPTYDRSDGALPASVDLVVIGAGVAGAATAYFAARAGLQVLVIERRSSIASLTTAAATGAFRLQHDNADELALVQEGLPLYLNFAEESGLTGWISSAVAPRRVLRRVVIWSRYSERWDSPMWSC
jgi:glycine/D-amino acid oxidase-like deaminating enzyme